MLLHGLGACGDSWGYQTSALSSGGLRVITPDIRGFGQSTYPGRGVSISDFASDMAYLLQSIGIEQAHIVGISMGGTVALQLALEFPQLVDRLVLVNTFARLRPERIGVLLYFVFRLILVHTLGLPAQARAVAHRIFPRPDQAQYHAELIREICKADPQGYRAAMRALARYNATQRLGEVRSPTLVISGELDNTVPINIQRRLAQGIPNSRHLIISKAGHAVIAEQPEIFNQMLLDYLTGRPRISTDESVALIKY